MLGVEEAMGTSILRICIFPNICQPSEAEELTAWMLVGSCGPLLSELKSIGGASMLAGCCGLEASHKTRRRFYTVSPKRSENFSLLFYQRFYLELWDLNFSVTPRPKFPASQNL